LGQCHRDPGDGTEVVVFRGIYCLVVSALESRAVFDGLDLIIDEFLPVEVCERLHGGNLRPLVEFIALGQIGFYI